MDWIPGLIGNPTMTDQTMKTILLVFVLLLLLAGGEKIMGKDGGACGCLVGVIVILVWLLL